MESALVGLRNMDTELKTTGSTPLPLIANSKSTAKLELFAKKLRFCCYKFNFSDQNVDFQEKELKRIYLNECIDFMEESRGILIEPIYAMSFAMIAHNIFRTLPPRDKDFDPEEDDPIYEPAWPHLKFVYAFFFRVLESPDFQPSVAKKFLDRNFVSHLIDMFCTDDVNELENLKIALHCIYGKFLGLRAYIRREISNKFMELVYEDLYYPGAAEVLEVLGSVINGYTCPLKQEHIRFLFQVLMPLHSSPVLQRFQAHLVYCVVQYLEKDPYLTEEVIKRFLKRWPKNTSAKELMFLGELEELIDVMPPSEYVKVQKPIFARIARCVNSEHFQHILRPATSVEDPDSNVTGLKRFTRKQRPMPTRAVGWRRTSH
ncbi:unnamed protein product [Clavelina lepadiformis]|uniref:Serine/threonine protein phosphatase 2A regulatory subunit n=1 Tax=Clavelina lepadiformis TaxID=159417 RepID=A0ABP0G358_CLALP